MGGYRARSQWFVAEGWGGGCTGKPQNRHADGILSQTGGGRWMRGHTTELKWGKEGNRGFGAGRVGR